MFWQHSRVVLLIVGYLLSGRMVAAQDVFPPFLTTAIQLQVPRHLPGYQADRTHEVGDVAVYNVVGQEFSTPGSGHLQTTKEGFSGTTDRSTPWKTLTELLAAYQTMDDVKIRSLYTTDAGTNAFFDEFWATPQHKAQFLHAAASLSGLDIVAGFEWQGGLFVFTRGAPTPPWDLFPFYLVQQAGEYRVQYNQAAVDSAQLGNIWQYYLFNPQPLSTPSIPAPPTRLTHGQSVNLQITLNTAGAWATVFLATLDERTRYSVRDGETDDQDGAAGSVTIDVSGNQFPIGAVAIQVVESNYPLEFVTQTLIDAAAGFPVIVSAGP